jgi:hypothetical protein
VALRRLTSTRSALARARCALWTASASASSTLPTRDDLLRRRRASGARTGRPHRRARGGPRRVYWTSALGARVFAGRAGWAGGGGAGMPGLGAVRGKGGICGQSRESCAPSGVAAADRAARPQPPRGQGPYAPAASAASSRSSWPQGGRPANALVRACSEGLRATQRDPTPARQTGQGTSRTGSRAQVLPQPAILHQTSPGGRVAAGLTRPRARFRRTRRSGCRR